MIIKQRLLRNDSGSVKLFVCLVIVDDSGYGIWGMMETDEFYRQERWEKSGAL